MIFAAPGADQSANRPRVGLRLGTLLLVTMLLAACGGGGGSGGGTGVSAGTGGPGATPATLVSMAIAPANPTLHVGASVKLGVTGNYSDGTTRDLSDTATWTSGATQVATVVPGGNVTGVTGGSTIIYAASGGIQTGTNLIVQGATITYLNVFGIALNDGSQPNGPLLLASDGNLYGTTRAGGGNRCFSTDNFCGAIFKLTPGGAETVLHPFGASASDGWSPTGPLIQGRDGAIYGMTTQGGAYDVGTVFRITLGGTYTVLHSFGPSLLDGQRPLGALLEASDGNFYGTTVGGGPNDCSQSGGDCGTIFRMSPTGDYRVLYSFGSSPGDGATPNGSLIEGSDGSFYGTTTVGGNLSCSALPRILGCGTVFRMTPAGAVTILHSFGASPADGMLPRGGLIIGADGAFYGTTYSGAGSVGTVFRITPAGATTILYAFAQPSPNGAPPLADGYNPGPFLLLARDGNFYGVTESVSQALTVRTGTIFRLTPSGVETTLFTFGPLGEGPSDPVGGLVQGADGAFYGVTAENGHLGAVAPRTGFGTGFRLTVP